MRSCIDTNVLVHADSGDVPVEPSQAISLTTSLRLAGAGLLPTQVLQEYVNVALRKLGLPPALVRQVLACSEGFEIVPASPALMHGAFDLHLTHGIALRQLGKLLMENLVQRKPRGAHSHSNVDGRKIGPPTDREIHPTR